MCRVLSAYLFMVWTMLGNKGEEISMQFKISHNRGAFSFI
jgi:hypothetical protein